MKKVLSLLLAVVLVATLSLSAEMMVSATDPAKIVVSSVEAAPGETVDVAISLKDNPGIVSMKLLVAFPSDLAFKEAKFGKDFTMSEDVGGPITSPEPYESPVILNWDKGVGNVVGDCEFAVISFTVASDAALGDKDITVTFDPEDVHNQDETNVPFSVENGKITVADPEYSITYNLDGGTNAANPAGYKYTSDTIELKNPTKKGYTFGGWYDNAEFTGEKVTEIAKGSTKGDKVFYAKWALNTYKITYNLNGGKSASGAPTTYKVTSADITLKAPTRTGYSFGGWYSDSAFKTKVTKITKGSTGNKTFYAKWSAVTYKITYKLNGGKNAKNPASFKVTSATITLKNPTRAGYKFGGWYTDSKFKNKITKITKGTAKNITLYAKWSVVTYKLTYKLNGGKNGKNPKSYNVTTKTFTLKAATRKGYTFKGWYSDSKFKKKVNKVAKGSTGNKTLYAKWAKKK